MSTGNGNNQAPPRAVMVPQAGDTARQEFGAQQLARSGETASTAVAAQARAMIESRYVMALQRPRDMDLARVRLIAACKRPRFALAARYRKPVGQGIEGPSIRLAEEAARCMGNIAVDILTIYDDARQRIVRVCATDLETNLPYSADVTIAKTVERNSVSEGQTVLSQRVGSRGQQVFVVSASDDEILNKQNAITSKALRSNLLRLVPADLLEEAMDQVYDTLRDRNAKDPGAERKALMDGFAALNVMPDRLKEYLGHDLDITTPAELIDLRGVYTAIRDGEATWAEVMDHRRKTEASEPKPEPKPEPTPAAPSATPAAAAKPPADTKPKGHQDLNEVAKATRERRGAPPPSGGPPSVSAKDAAEPEDRGDDPLRDERGKGKA